MAGRFAPKTAVQLNPPKDDPITVEELAKATGVYYLHSWVSRQMWSMFPTHRMPRSLLVSRYLNHLNYTCLYPYSQLYVLSSQPQCRLSPVSFIFYMVLPFSPLSFPPAHALTHGDNFVLTTYVLLTHDHRRGWRPLLCRYQG